MVTGFKIEDHASQTNWKTLDTYAQSCITDYSRDRVEK